MKKLLLTTALLATALAGYAQDETGIRECNVGNFENPAEHLYDGSFYQRSPFQFYTKYTGSQFIYPASMLKQIADDNGSITEVIFKYGDNGSTAWITAKLNLFIQNYEPSEFEKQAEGDQYYWCTFDNSAPSSTLDYEVELYYYEDEEIHFVLDRPLLYDGHNLLITVWSEVTNGQEAQAMQQYVVETDRYTNMNMASDRDSETFERIYDTGLQFPYMGPMKYVPIAKFRYTTGDGITSAATTPADAPATLYNLQGQTVTGTPAPGLYIRRQGDTATKVYIK